MTAPIALALLGAGLVLMVSAYRNESPIDVTLKALGRQTSVAKLGAGGAAIGLGGAGSTSSGGSTAGGSGPSPSAGGGGGGGSW